MTFRDLYQKWYGFLYFWVLSQMRNREEAEDICSLAFSRAFEKIDQLQDPDKFKSWLFQISGHAIHKHYHREKIIRFEALEEIHEETIPDTTDFIQELEKYYDGCRLENAMSAIGTVHRQALKRYLSGKTCQGTWGSRLNHAKKEIRRLIAV